MKLFRRDVYMDYLSRDAAPFADDFWQQLDNTITETASKILQGRRFVPIYGPLGIGVTNIELDDVENLKEVADNGIIFTAGRSYIQIPTLYTDFILSAKDMQTSQHSGYPVDLAQAINAAEQAAIQEDKFIFFGNDTLKIDGLFTAAGTQKITKTDWNIGENSFKNIAEAINLLVKEGIYSSYSLLISPDLYLQMQRIQPGTGILEIDRVKKLLHKRVFVSPVLGKEKALLISADARNIDLAIGQDLQTAYLEQTELNHKFRLLETIRLRIKRPKSIIQFE